MHLPQDLIFPGFFQGVGSTELLIILFVILLLFGAKKLPELARGMGKSLREFKKATTEIEDDFRAAMDEKDSPEPMAPAKIEPIAGGNASPPEEKEETRA